MKVFIPLIPQGKARHRARAISRPGMKPIATTYSCPKQKDHVDQLRKLLALWWREPPTEKILKVKLIAYMPIPKSLPKKGREQCFFDASVLVEPRPAKKPDVSNILKLIEDAANGIVYKDDSQIVEVEAKKFYSERPGYLFEITPLEVEQEKVS